MELRKFSRLICGLLTICLLMAALPVATAADEQSGGTNSTDFVLVMDCSGTMRQNDPQGLAASACKMFIDLIPIQDARVSVIAIGYQDKNDAGFEYSVDYSVKYDNELIHQIVPMSELSTVSQKDGFKREVDTASRELGERTPIGQGLAAAVDVLTQNNSGNENACIILLSDGVMTSSNILESDRLVKEAAYSAQAHEWPIFCIELDYFNNNHPGSDADKLLNSICINSGSGTAGRMKVTSPADVCQAFLEIFNTFMTGGGGNISPTVIDESGVAEKEFYIPNLVSEASIVVSGSAVERVELINVDQNTTKEITGNLNSDNLQASVETGSYYCLKLICPEEGNWKIRAYGDPNAQILVYDSSLQEMALSMVARASSNSDVLHKDDYITVDAVFSYLDHEIHSNPFYVENTANLVVRSEDGTAKEFPMTGTENGYTYNLKVGDVPSGKFSIQVELKHTMFRNGKKSSNAATFISENRSLEHGVNAPTELKVYMNSLSDKLDLTEIFNNPDGDQITYSLVCVSDRSVSFDYTIDEAGYLTIFSGTTPGVFTLELSGSDPDMSAPVVHTMKFEVIDRQMEQEELPEVELWVDSYGFQNNTVFEYSLDLNDYFEDPDGLDISYMISGGDASVVEVDQDNSLVRLVPAGEGDIVLFVSADDMASTVRAEITVKCISGKALFWAENWIWFALAAALILLIMILVIFISKNTKVKGTWTITFEENGNTATAESVSIGILSVGRRKSFKLKELVDEVSRFVDDYSGVMAHVPNYFMDKNACAIELKGVPSGKGFVVRKIPDCETVSVEYVGRKISKKVRVTTGYITFRLSTPGEFGMMQDMVITMQSADLY